MQTHLKNLEKTYTIEKELGRGGMGVVYLATDTRLDRKVAIKVLSISGGNENTGVSLDEVVQRFQREAKAVAKLTHQNIVNIYDFGSEDGLYYMVMEFVDGKSLYDLIVSNSLEFNLVLNVGVQICSALDFAHENGIIHRDIKPANIILSKKGIAKLMDFGIAQLGKESSQRLTQSGTLLGSIMYISPEQLTDSSQVDARSDIYSLGMSIYEMFTGGKLPFDGDNIPALVMKIMSQEPIPPSSFNPLISPELDRVILKSITKDPSRRYQTAGEMGNDLSRILNNLAPEQSYAQTVPVHPTDMKATLILNTEMTFTSASGSTMIIKPNSSVENLLRKTLVNQAFIESLEKDYYWIKLLIKTWNSRETETTDFYKELARVTDQSSFANMFSGAMLINEEVFIFIHEGYLTGAIDIANNHINKNALDHINSNPIDKIELFYANNETKYAPVILSSIITPNQALQEDLDSSNIDLIPLIDNLISGISPFSGYIKCRYETNVVYYAFADGNNIFACCVDDDDEVLSNIDYKDIKNFVSTNNVLLTTYHINPTLLKPSISKLLADAHISIKLRDNAKSGLLKLLEFKTGEIPNYVLKEIKQNVYTEIDLNKSFKIKILDKDIDLMKILTESMHYRFAEWLTNEYLYLVSSTNNSSTLKLAYTYLPELKTIQFNTEIEGESGEKCKFDVIGYAKSEKNEPKKLLFVATIGSGDRADIDRFIGNVNDVKKKYIKNEEFCAAFYISFNSFESNSIKMFYDHTVEYKKGFVFSLDRSSKYKGFIKLSSGRGVHLHFIEYSNKVFSIILPKMEE